METGTALGDLRLVDVSGTTVDLRDLIRELTVLVLMRHVG